MKVFVINLDKNVERMRMIDAQLTKLNLKYERIRAVYGKELPPEEKSRSVNKFAFWCVRGYKVRDGEIGCALSHLIVYRKMVEEDIPIACVLEDDADPHECLPQLLDWHEQHVDVEQAVVSLISNHGHQESQQLGMYPIRTGAFTDGYIITKAAAAIILKKNFPIKGPSDSWTFWRSKRWIELYQATPAGCNQRWEDEGYCSDVTPDINQTVSVAKMNVVEKVIWKLKRLLGKTIAAIVF